MTLLCSAYLWSVGVMEYWSNDERIDVFFFQHSNTPSLQYSKAETFKNFCNLKITFLLVIIPKKNKQRQRMP